MSRMVRIPRQIDASRTMVKLPYYNSVVLNTVETPAQAEYLFSVNSAFDPDLTGTGSQPRGFDQWAAKYSRYQVKGLAYKILLRPSSDSAVSTSAVSMLLGITAGPEGFSSQNFANITDYMEYPKSQYHKWRTTARNVTVESENAAYNSKPRYFTGYISCKSLTSYYGRKGINTADAAGALATWPTDFSAAVNSDPGAELELCLWGAALPQNGSASLPALPHVHADVSLTYYVEFYNPIYPSAS